ncbi:MAG: isopentenyl phosphate kinase [Nitrososphaerales archaeon]
MDRKQLTICKLGGSVITFKDKPFTPNMKAIQGLGVALASLEGKLVVIHGGGSFGHYMASRFGIGQSPSNNSSKGVAMTRQSMLELHLTILKTFLDVGLSVYSVPLSCFMNQRQPSKEKILALQGYYESRITPMTFGDVLVSTRGSYIVSGDQIAAFLSKYLKPRRVIFALDVDGIYQDQKKMTLIPELGTDKSTNLDLSKRKIDVTGGVARKIQEATKIAQMGIDVSFVNGLVPQRLVDAAQGQDPLGTVIRGARDSSLSKK